MKRTIRESAKIIEEIYAGATREFTRVILSSDSYSRIEKFRMISQMASVAKILRQKTEEWVDNEATIFYMQGTKDTVKLFASVSRPINGTLGRIQNESLRSLIESTNATFAEAISGVTRNGVQILDNATKQRIRAMLTEGMVSNETLKDIKTGIVEELKNGFIALKDKSGREWSLESYSKMLARTKLTEATNLGTIDTIQKNGYNLGIINSTGTKCELCKPWEGQVVSFDGFRGTLPSGIKVVPYEEVHGIWHPNCQHRVLPFQEEFSKQAVRWSRDLQRYI